MQSFKDVVEAYEGKFTEADRALASVILNDPNGVMFLSTAELASRAQVHASTVVRLARKLGFEGYLDLRQRLRMEYGGTDGPEAGLRRRLTMIDRGSNLMKLIESEVAALAAIPQTLSQEQIDKAAQMLIEASAIRLVGRGGTVPLIAHLERRLRRSGFRTTSTVNQQRRDTAEWFSSLRRDEAVVAFAFLAPESLPEGFEGLMRHIKRVGAKLVIVSDASGSTLRPRPDVLLSVSRPDEGSMALRLGPMLVCEALAMTMAHLQPERAVAEYRAIEKLRAEMEEK